MAKHPLNPEQKAISAWRGGPLLALAGAGAGKTTTLVATIVDMIRSGIRPSSILAQTFTKKAGDKLKADLIEALGIKVNPLDKGAMKAALPFAGTFHAFCLDVMRERLAEFAGKEVDQFLIKDWRKTAILEEVLKEMELADEEDATLLLSRIALAKNALVYADQETESVAFFTKLLHGNKREGAKMAEVYRRYQGKVRGLRLCDFDDWLLVVYRLFERHPEVLAEYQARYQYILSDEVQDQNYAQTAILDTLAAAHRNVFLVGDVKQSIYQFRGADPEATVLAFKERYSEGKILPLETNYRSDGAIIQAANNLTANMRIPMEFRGKLVASKPALHWPDVHACETTEDESELVANEIQSLRIGGCKLSEMAVLYRTNSQSAAPEQALIRHKIPYIIIGGTSFYERKEVKDMLGYLEIAKNPVSPAAGDAIKRVLNYATEEFAEDHYYKGSPSFTHLISKEFIGGLIGRSRGQNVSIWEALRPYAQQTPGIWRNQKDGVDDFIGVITVLRDMARKGSNPGEMLQYVYHEVYSHHLARTAEAGADTDTSLVGSDPRRENCLQLIADMSRFKDVDGALSYVNYLQVQASKNKAADADSVQLMTIHKSKGLEFDHVFGIGVEEGTLPHGRADEEEERRLMYVLCTRPRKGLHLSHKGDPSHFIAELGLPEPETMAGEDPRLSAILAGEAEWTPEEANDWRYREGREMDHNAPIGVRFNAVTADTLDTVKADLDAIDAKHNPGVITLSFNDADDEAEEQ